MSRFKVGDLVRVVGEYPGITKGKIYDVINVIKNPVEIGDDDGDIQRLHAGEFEVVRDKAPPVDLSVAERVYELVKSAVVDLRKRDERDDDAKALLNDLETILSDAGVTVRTSTVVEFEEATDGR